MSRRFVAFTVLALAGAALALPEPAFAAGGMRGMPGGGFRAPLIMRHSPRAVLPTPLRAIARPAFMPRLGHAFGPHGFGHARHGIPPSPPGFATTTPERPFGRLARRHHGFYQSGWYFPTTIGDDGGYGYIGTPYDPAAAIPVYGPAPAYDEPADPPARPATARVTNTEDGNRDSCRAERVTVPAGDGEREIKVVRC
jgi:hypothetical protein